MMAAETPSAINRIALSVCWCTCAVAVALVAVLSCSSATDFVFRVPEVLVRHGVGSAHSDPLSAVVPPPPPPPPSSPDETTSVYVTDEYYAQYLVEHSISTVDARQAAKTVNLEEVGAVEGCGKCTAREQSYCETQVLEDHCCCEKRYLSEPMPWIPHTCYVGAEKCRPVAGDCARYARVRDCCCLQRLAVKWKEILLSGRAEQPISTSLLLLMAAWAVLVMR